MSNLDKQLQQVIEQWYKCDYLERPTSKYAQEAVALIEQGADPNMAVDRQCMLVWAIHGRSPKLMEAIFKAGGDPNGIDNDQILVGELQKLGEFAGKIQKIKKLISSPTRQDTQVFQQEFELEMKMVQLLIKHGAQDEPHLNAFVALLHKAQQPDAIKLLHPVIESLFDAGFVLTPTLDRARKLSEETQVYLTDAYETWSALKQADFIVKEAQLDVTSIERRRVKI